MNLTNILSPKEGTVTVERNTGLDLTNIFSHQEGTVTITNHATGQKACLFFQPYKTTKHYTKIKGKFNVRAAKNGVLETFSDSVSANLIYHR